VLPVVFAIAHLYNLSVGSVLVTRAPIHLLPNEPRQAITRPWSETRCWVELRRPLKREELIPAGHRFVVTRVTRAGIGSDRQIGGLTHVFLNSKTMNELVCERAEPHYSGDPDPSIADFRRATADIFELEPAPPLVMNR
jgi:hypothetical protein